MIWLVLARVWLGGMWRTVMHLDAIIIGGKLNQGPIGSSIAADDMKMRSVSDVYAAGDITRSGRHTVGFASADGFIAGLAIHPSLAFEA